MPMKVKFFCENDPRALQEPINKWLTENPDIHITHITQSQVQHGQIGPMAITICIWYT